MTEEIVFKTEADMPYLPMSLGTTLVNKTGSWRYIRPLYVDKTPPCNHYCPAGEDIVGYLALIKEGKYKEAWELIKQENPFPGVCGRVCPHPCESECNREEFGSAIAIHTLERFLADWAASQGLSVQASQRYDAEVAVIGSGPAGCGTAEVSTSMEKVPTVDVLFTCFTCRPIFPPRQRLPMLPGGVETKPWVMLTMNAPIARLPYLRRQKAIA